MLKKILFVLLAFYLDSAFADFPMINLNTIPPDALGVSYFGVKNSTYDPKYDPSNPKIRFVCKFAKSGFFDPIVYPGEVAAGHHHTFFGNTGVTGLSALDEILSSGNSTCTGGTAFRSAMWVPSIVDWTTGKYITPKEVIVYYMGSYSSKASPMIQSIPDGLAMITGDALNTSPTGKYQTSKRIKFSCYNSTTSTSYSPTIPNCAAGWTLRFSPVFPECWDGVNLDSPDHKSHMAFQRTGDYLKNANECPSSHPVRVPQIALHIDYKINAGDNTTNWRFVSDNYDTTTPGGLSGHADYIIGINKKIRDMITENILRPMKDGKMGELGIDPEDGVLKKLY